MALAQPTDLSVAGIMKSGAAVMLSGWAASRGLQHLALNLMGALGS